MRVDRTLRLRAPAIHLIGVLGREEMFPDVRDPAIAAVLVEIRVDELATTSGLLDALPGFIAAVVVCNAHASVGEVGGQKGTKGVLLSAPVRDGLRRGQRDCEGCWPKTPEENHDGGCCGGGRRFLLSFEYSNDCGESQDEAMDCPER